MNNTLEAIKETSKVDFLPILSDECEKVLISLLKEYEPKNILEIGTCVGYSSTIMLLNSNAHVDTIEIDKIRQMQAIDVWKNYNVQNRITSYLGDVNNILEDVIKDKEYDFVFLDGPKSRYLEHLQKCMPNVKAGGIILADDVLFFGLVNGEEKVHHKHRTIVKHLREFMEYIQTNEMFDTQIINEGNGIAIIKKK